MPKRVTVRIADTPVLGSVIVDGAPLVGVLSLGVESNPHEADTVIVIRMASRFLDIEHVADRPRQQPVDEQGG